MLLIAHNSDYDCRFILTYLEHVEPIVKGCRFFSNRSDIFQPNKTKENKDIHKI